MQTFGSWHPLWCAGVQIHASSKQKQNILTVLPFPLALLTVLTDTFLPHTSV